MAIKNIKRWASAIAESGANHTAFWYKTSVPINVNAGRWSDYSMGAGIPKYNAYVGSQLEATALYGSANNGLYAGQEPAAGLSKYINTFAIMPASTSFSHCFTLADYLLFYPLIEGDNTDLQEMDNTQTLPRYTTGEGVRCMLVCTTACTSDATITVTYTNQAGVAGRVSTSTYLGSQSYVGAIISGANVSAVAGRNTPFIPLANGDTGMRSIESVQISVGSGGFFAAVLVKPLMMVQGLDNGITAEKQCLIEHSLVPVKIESGAYLNFFCLPNHLSGGAPFRGYLEIVHQ